MMSFYVHDADGNKQCLQCGQARHKLDCPVPAAEEAERKLEACRLALESLSQNAYLALEYKWGEAEREAADGRQMEILYRETGARRFDIMGDMIAE